MSQFIDQQQRRQRTLATPIKFSVALGTNTTIYTGIVDQFFLVREAFIANTTVASVELTLTGGGDSWITGQSIPANTTTVLEGLKGAMLLDSEDIVGSGSGLVVYGWGLRIEGANDWTL